MFEVSAEQIIQVLGVVALAVIGVSVGAQKLL